MGISRIFLVLGLCGLVGMVHELQASQPDPGHRTQTTYYANGRMRTLAEYRDGRRQGASRAFYADGTVMAEGAYDGGLMDGSWTFYGPDGTPDRTRSGRYVGGVLQPQ